jgi:hypothetical protein
VSAIRLRVSYKSPQAVLSEFTKSVGKGAVALESKRDLPPGTKFLFELAAQGVESPVEVTGEVVSSRPLGKRFLLTIRYDAGVDRKGLDSVLQQIFESHKYDKARKHPRVPLNLRATADAAYSTSYLVRDISMGGVGIEVESPTLPSMVKVGELFLLEVWLTLGTLALHGEVVWLSRPPGEAQKVLNPAFGVRFGRLHGDSTQRLEQIVSLRALPPPPWRARVSFGKEAMARMP